MDLSCNFRKDKRQLLWLTLYYSRNSEHCIETIDKISLSRNNSKIWLGFWIHNPLCFVQIIYPHPCLPGIKSHCQVSVKPERVWKSDGKREKAMVRTSGTSEKIIQPNFPKHKILSSREHQTLLIGIEESCW